MNKIEEDIRSGTFSRVYLLYGEEDYLKEHYVGQLKKALIAEGDEINLNIWRGGDVDVTELISQAMTMPFFAPHRLIILIGSGLFRAGGSELADALPGLPPETVLVFSEEEVDARGRLFKQVRSMGVVLKQDRQKEEALQTWILRRLTREGKIIRYSTMDLLLERTGNDMCIIDQEVEKLLCYTADREEILPEDVRAVITVQTGNRIFELADAITRSQADRALSIYYDLLALKESPIGILALLSKQFQRFLIVKEFREQGLDVNAISDRLQSKTFIIRKNLGQVSGYTAKDLEEILHRILLTDEAVKTGRMGDKAAVELLILELVKEAGSHS